MGLWWLGLVEAVGLCCGLGSVVPVVDAVGCVGLR